MFFSLQCAFILPTPHVADRARPRNPRIDELRASWEFLPDRNRVVLEVREGENGGVVIYDDGLLFEFGAGLPWIIRDPAREIAFDGGDLRFGEPPAPIPAETAIRMFLAKLYIGVGRLRRGERVAASAHIRTYAVEYLCAACRDHFKKSGSSAFEPVRRFDFDMPDIGRRLADLLDRDTESCARGLLALAREMLEPDWPEFPSTAADVISFRLGWDASS